MSQREALARSAAAGNREDMYTLLTTMIAQHDLINAATGNNWKAPTNSPQQPSSPPPPQASISVAGANGAYTLSIKNPSLSLSATIYHEVSFSPIKSFSNDVTTLSPSAATSVNLPAVGQTQFVRIRSSYDQANWNSYSLAQQTPVAGGYQTSAATENGVPLNTSNYAIVDSVAVGASADVRVYGTAGPNTMWPGVKGANETIYPSATIINVPLSSNPIVGIKDNQFSAIQTLPQVFPDATTPVGQVSVVGGGAVTLPTVDLVLDGSGRVIAYNVTGQGNGLTGPVTLTITTSTGTGATFGTQTISGGKLIAIAPGNPGLNYHSGDTVNVSGGTFTGQPGGGQVTGGNGGRLTAISS